MRPVLDILLHIPILVLLSHPHRASVLYLSSVFFLPTYTCSWLAIDSARLIVHITSEHNSSLGTRLGDQQDDYLPKAALHRQPPRVNAFA